MLCSTKLLSFHHKKYSTIQGYCVNIRKRGGLVTETPRFWEKYLADYDVILPISVKQYLRYIKL